MDNTDIEKIDKQIAEAPLSYEEAKEQFYRMTNELGIKHTFTFDEMWESMARLRREKEFKESLRPLAHALLKEGIPKEDIGKYNPVDHQFADGLYSRSIYNPPNSLIVTKIHEQENMFFLMEGQMFIITEYGVDYIEAPHYGITPKGTQRVIYTCSDCTFITVHATNERDIEKLEQTIATDPTDMPILEDVGVQSALKTILKENE